MIVSHAHRFIFLRTEKTGGSSFLKVMHEQLDPSEFPADLPRPLWSKYTPIHQGGLRRAFPKVFGLHRHATAKHVRDIIGRKVFDSYFKFAIERNPWDRQISLYAHRQWKKGKSVDSFDRDMRSILYRSTGHVKLNNWAVYSIDGQIVADRVLRYERLSEELDEVLGQLGLPQGLEMPRLRSYVPNRPHYSTYYSDYTRDLIARWYANEIKALGYQFETVDGARRPGDRAPAAETDMSKSLLGDAAFGAAGPLAGNRLGDNG
jgi:hypothetical protein